jgi:flagellar hook-associated protein 2
MATASVSGLVSGLDTASIISQLMQVEAQTQTRIKSRLSSEQSNVTMLQELNSLLAALVTSAGDQALATAWNPVRVTSSSDQVSASAGADSTRGSVSVTIGHTARAHQLSFASTAALTDVVTTGSSVVRLDRLDGTTLDIDTGDGSLQGLLQALNAAGTGVTASTVRLDDGSHRLQVAATGTGAASDFTLTNLDGSDLLGGAVIVAGRDAEITIGTDTVHSATNTFTDIAAGLSITLKGGVTPGTQVDLTVEQDSQAMTATVKGIVTAINEVLTRIDGLTAYNSASKTAGALAGDVAVRSVRNSLLTSVYPADGTSLAGVGIQLDRYGKLTFDEAKFAAAYDSDPAAVAASFTGATGFASRVQAVAKAASDPVTGTVTTSIGGRNSSIKRMRDSIEDWDNRLTLRKETLTRQFAALESALSRMNSQSTWLAGQINALSSSRSGS